MKRSFKLEELDCADCASKMERDINKIDGVNKATINFMTSKITLDAADEAFDAVLDEAQRICAGYEPDCVIVR